MIYTIFPVLSIEPVPNFPGSQIYLRKFSDFFYVLKEFCWFYLCLHFSTLSHVSVFIRVLVRTYTSFRTFICTYISFRISIFTYTRLPVFILTYIAVKTFNIYLQTFLSFYPFCCVYTPPGFRIDVNVFKFSNVFLQSCASMSVHRNFIWFGTWGFLVTNVARHGNKWNCEPLSTAAEFNPLNFIILHLINLLTSLYVTQVHKRLQQSRCDFFLFLYNFSHVPLGKDQWRIFLVLLTVLFVRKMR